MWTVSGFCNIRCGKKGMATQAPQPPHQTPLQPKLWPHQVVWSLTVLLGRWSPFSGPWCHWFPVCGCPSGAGWSRWGGLPGDGLWRGDSTDSDQHPLTTRTGPGKDNAAFTHKRKANYSRVEITCKVNANTQICLIHANNLLCAWCERSIR